MSKKSRRNGKTEIPADAPAGIWGSLRLTYPTKFTEDEKKSFRDIIKSLGESARIVFLETEVDSEKKEANPSTTVIVLAPFAPPAPEGVFPWWWQLFPFILPRSVRERVYEPAFEELKEDYLLAAPLWTGWFSRRWLTFCFSIRTFKLFVGSLWAATWGALTSRTRKAIFGFIALLVGAQNSDVIRQKLSEWFGRLL